MAKRITKKRNKKRNKKESGKFKTNEKDFWKELGPLYKRGKSKY